MNANSYFAPLPLRVFALIIAFLFGLLTACASENGRSPSPPPIAAATATATVTTTSTTLPTNTPAIQPTNTVTITSTNSPTAQPTNTTTPRPTATPTATAVPPEFLVNGLLLEQFLILPSGTQNHIRDIYALGQTYGRNPRTFAKLGDSIVLTPHFLARFDSKQYDLGLYDRLQPTIDRFAGSFARFGQAAHVSLSARTLFETGWADEELCQEGEHVVACEIRLHNPSLFIIHLGTNDLSSDIYEGNMRRLITYLLDQGIIPILGTKADRHEGEDNRNNEILRQLAVEYKIPLWDFDVVADTLPDRGLSGDFIHLTMSGSNDYTHETTLQKGYPVSDLTALMMLDAIRRIVDEE